MRKRLEEAAAKYVRDWECIISISTKTAFRDGAEWMFKECGGKTILHDMRKLILAQCREWLKDNAHDYSFSNEGCDALLADFETDMNKLWEEQK